MTRERAARERAKRELLPMEWYQILMQKREPFTVIRDGSDEPVQVLPEEVRPNDLILRGNMRMLNYAIATAGIEREPIRNAFHTDVSALVCVQRTGFRNGQTYTYTQWVKGKNVRPDDIIVHNAHNVTLREEHVPAQKAPVASANVLDNKASHAARVYALFAKLSQME